MPYTADHPLAPVTSNVTSALRTVGAGAEAQRRAFATSVRQLADVAPAQLLDWIAWALRFSAATVAAEQKGSRAAGVPMKNGFVIVDRERTRC
jgi:hypothetical protein